MNTGDQRPETADRGRGTRDRRPGIGAALIGIVAALSLALPGSGWAQETGSIEVAGGYGFLGDFELVDGYSLGWFAEGGWRTIGWLSLIGEVSRHQRTQDVGFIDIEVTFQTLLAGARVWARTPRFGPFRARACRSHPP